MGIMSKHRPGPKPKPGAKERGPILYLRLDEDTEAALQDFIGAQIIPPDRTAVGLKAIHELLQKHGYWPRKKPDDAK